MQQNQTKWKRYGLSAFLIISIVALLAVYSGMTRNLPAQIYTPNQQELISYSNMRSLSQAPIVTNRYDAVGLADTFFTVDSGQPIMPANFSVWENQVDAVLDANYEEENGVSVTKYDLEFNSTYHFQYAPTGVTSTLEIIFPFPSNLETLNDVTLLVDDEEPANVEYTYQQIRWLTELAPGDEHDVLIHYQADGVGSFTYGLSQDRRTDLLDVVITVNGMRGSEVPTQSLPTTRVTQSAEGGEKLRWQYDKLLANRDIQLTLPHQLSFAQKAAALQDDFRTLSIIAPFLVGLFLVSLGILMNLKGVQLDLSAYLLSGLGLALFYPLLTFFSGLIGAIPAAIVTLILVIGLLGLFLFQQVEDRKTVFWILWLVVIFLGFLSLGILTPYRGILLSLGGFLLVGTFMVAYAKRPLSSDTQIEETENTDQESNIDITDKPLSIIHVHCPKCGRGLEDGFDYCPGCGYDAQQISLCPSCHHEQVSPEIDGTHYCVHCGAELS